MKYMVAFTFLQQEHEAILAHLPEEQARAKSYKSRDLLKLPTSQSTSREDGW